MNEGIRVRSAKEFFEEFGRGKIYQQHMLKDQVKKELVDTFQKEIFSIVADRAKKRFSDIPKEGDPEALRIAANVVKDETKKWKKVVQMFEQYSETSGCIKYEDLYMVPEEGNGEIGFQDGKLVTRETVMKDGPEEVDDNGNELAQNEPVTSGYVAVQEDISGENAQVTSTEYASSRA